MAEVDQGIQAGIALEVHTAAVATIAAVRPTVLNILLPAKRRRAIAASSGSYMNGCFINKFHNGSILFWFHDTWKGVSG